MKSLKITIEYWKEGNLFMAFSPELDMMGQGYNLEEAKKNLFLTIKIFINCLERLNIILSVRYFSCCVDFIINFIYAQLTEPFIALNLYYRTIFYIFIFLVFILVFVFH